MDKQRIIKISQNRIYIAPDYFFLIEETSLPQQNFSFKSIADIYWLVEITGFEKETKSLSLRVIDYSPTNIEGFIEQKVKSNVNYLHFEKFQWDKLESFLSLYRKADLTRFLEYR